MTRDKLLLGTCVAAWLFLSSVAAQNLVGSVSNDSSISSRARAALLANPVTKDFQIKVNTQNGSVQLEGVVDSVSQKITAENVVRTVDGVSTVDNNLRISGDEPTVGVVINDSDISAKVKAALLSDSRTRDHQIKVKTNDRVVVLGGFVNNDLEKQVAEALAEDVAGVIKVENDIVVGKH